METETYLRNFFNEKQIPFQTFEIRDAESIVHLINTDVIIEAVLYTSAVEQKQIANVLRQIAIRNGSITHFLKYLAHGLVQQYAMAS